MTTPITIAALYEAHRKGDLVRFKPHTNFVTIEVTKIVRYEGTDGKVARYGVWGNRRIWGSDIQDYYWTGERFYLVKAEEKVEVIA